ncbi:hypothetical protein ABK040_006467 [Willaertia magna]
MSEEDGGIGAEAEEETNTNNKPTTNNKRESISSYVYMEKIIDKLKLLNYERKRELIPKIGFGAIPKFYFAHHDKDHPHDQFHTFISLTNWLIVDLLKQQDYEKPDVQIEDPNTIVTNLVFQLKKMGIPIDFSPAKLRQAYGESVCYVLDQLLNRSLKECKVKLRVPQIPDEIKFREDEEMPEESEDIEDTEENIPQDSDEEDEMYFSGISKNNDKAIKKKTEEFTVSNVDANEWKLSVEHVAPQLIVRLNVDHKDWRTHVEGMSDQDKSIKELLPSSSSQLDKIAEEIEKINTRIQKREKMLSDDSSISNLLSSYTKNQQELDEITKKYKELEETITSLSTELNKISQDLGDVKNNAEELTKKMADPAPLKEIKEALVKIRSDIKQMDMRAGVLQNQVLQAKLKTSRVMSAKGKKISGNQMTLSQNGFEFDPFLLDLTTTYR